MVIFFLWLGALILGLVGIIKFRELAKYKRHTRSPLVYLLALCIVVWLIIVVLLGGDIFRQAFLN